MQLFIQALLVITYVAGTSCQKITFDNTGVGGIKQSRIYIDGTIGENVTELLLQKWQPNIFIMKMGRTDSVFSHFCQYGVSGGKCTTDQFHLCQCFYNTTTDTVHFMIEGIPAPLLHKAIIRAEWRHENLTTVYSNKNYTVPEPDGEVTSAPAAATTASTTTKTITSTTTESPSLSSSSTSSVLLKNTTSRKAERVFAEPGSCSSIFCDLYLAFSLLFLELLGGVAYATIWCMFFKKNEDNTQNTQSMPMKKEEHHQVISL